MRGGILRSGETLTVKLVIRLLAFLFLWLVMAGAAVADERPAFMPGWTWESLARWTGCSSPVMVIEDDDPNAYFSPGGFFAGPRGVYLTTGLLKLPAPQVFIVLLHELAHCRQAAEGRLGGDSVALEQEADVMAADWACRLGHAGVRIAEDFWREIGYDLDAIDEGHGSPRERIAETARRAGSCRAVADAPYVGS